MIILDATTLLQTNAAVIAGLLILLTLLSLRRPETIPRPRPPEHVFSVDMPTEERTKLAEELIKDTHDMATKYFLAIDKQIKIIKKLSLKVYAIIPFSISAITIFFLPLYIAELLMVAGFAYLVFDIVLVVKIYQEIASPSGDETS